MKDFNDANNVKRVVQKIDYLSSKKVLLEGVKFRTIERHKLEATRISDKLYRNLYLQENGQLSSFLGLPKLGNYEAIYAWVVDYMVKGHYPYLEVSFKEVKCEFYELIMNMNNTSN
ncbi:hypothetical protein [Thalassomonas sp. M1454]|uniref:hypothetical protein n=1 Tax=Thalassomonas sp. M1454 TaxID=2594477 RepID=UPI001180A1CD|nr:hypothetical protein [Thalassomonas sp. M1454]TRX57971.1 hypothetical protein FNN08_00870 [Thalassomonas sp. M1454]